MATAFSSLGVYAIHGDSVVKRMELAAESVI
jgi:hypothetical protein